MTAPRIITSERREDDAPDASLRPLVLADFDSTVGADAKLELRGQFTLSSSDFSFF